MVFAVDDDRGDFKAFIEQTFV